MWPEPGDPRTGRFEGIRRWWLALPLAMRINAALYALAGIAALVLLIDLTTSREDPRRVEVAQQSTTIPAATTTTAAAAPPPPETTAPASSTTSPGGGATTTSSAPRGRTSTTAAPRVAAPQTPAPAPAPVTTTAPRDCRNSTDSACGNFVWDPPPQENLPVTVSVTASNDRPSVNENVTFTLVAADGDHLLDDRCARIEFGDGVVGTGSGSCTPPSCPAAFGPWTPPARTPGRFEGGIAHAYGTPGTYEVRVTFSNREQSCTNPYSGSGTGTVQITVTG